MRILSHICLACSYTFVYLEIFEALAWVQYPKVEITYKRLCFGLRLADFTKLAEVRPLTVVDYSTYVRILLHVLIEDMAHYAWLLLFFRLLPHQYILDSGLLQKSLRLCVFEDIKLTWFWLIRLGFRFYSDLKGRHSSQLRLLDVSYDLFLNLYFLVYLVILLIYLLHYAANILEILLCFSTLMTIKLILSFEFLCSNLKLLFQPLINRLIVKFMFQMAAFCLRLRYLTLCSLYFFIKSINFLLYMWSHLHNFVIRAQLFAIDWWQIVHWSL